MIIKLAGIANEISKKALAASRGTMSQAAHEMSRESLAASKAGMSKAVDAATRGAMATHAKLPLTPEHIKRFAQ